MKLIDKILLIVQSLEFRVQSFLNSQFSILNSQLQKYSILYLVQSLEFRVQRFLISQFKIQNSKFIILNFLLITSFLALAQPRVKPKEDEDIVVVSNDFIKNEKSILVKWFSKDYMPQEGYNVYRKLANGGTWQKINSEPVKFQKTIPSSLNIDSEEKKYWEASQKLKPSDIDKAGMLIGYTYLKVINSMDFAQLMGMAYIDKTVEASQEYVYMVKILKNNKEEIVDSSLAIRQAAWEPEKGISKISPERKRKEINLKFTVEHSKYYAIDIERKPMGAASFIDITSGPYLLQKNQDGQWPEAPYIDQNISKDTAYVYVIYGINYFGRKTKPSSEIFVQKKDFDPPKPVTDVQYDQDTLNVKLSWKPSPEKDDDLKGYHVYRSLHYDKDYEKVTASVISMEKMEYIDKVPFPGEYYYMVVSVDKNDNESGAAAVMADIRDVVAPQVPKNIKAFADSGKVKLSWEMNLEKDFKGYLIYKSIAGKNVFVPVNGDPIRENFYQEKLAKQVKNKFVYKVVAIDSSFNRSKYSDSVSVKLPDLFAPTKPIIKNVEASSTGKGIKIEWLPSVDNDLRSFEIYRINLNSKDKQASKIATLDASASEYVDLTAQKNISFQYYLTSNDSAGNSSVNSELYPFKWSSTKSSVIIKSFKVKLSNKDLKASITWEIEKGPDFKGCVLFRSYNGEEMAQYSGNLKDQINFEDTKLKIGKYTYYLKAYDTFGNIIKSEEKTIVLEPEENK